MRRTIQRKGLTLPSKSVQMINNPTVSPISGVAGQGLPTVDTDPFFSIEVSTAGAPAGATQTVILFDAGGGYQLGLNQSSGPNVVIRGLTANYQFILNDVVHNGSFFSRVKMHVLSTGGVTPEEISLVQYNHPLSFYSASKGSQPRLLKTIHPTMGVNEQQYHFNINTFTANLLVGNREALVYEQEPDTRIVWSFYQTAEVGRIQ